ncbi:uncharacterized protein BXZ73DRAFT_100064 [Epithele typhae]|uniref:uncharacterized protein n=1 Tax=Epithele typhae TaxID=378194 RepID=UPI002007939C|nr:uncharacterized protein BXZ73DRAFT_100064 [Epithele typhae]KAH9937851.1 hypothetical protein BXZ73DRAFT_100064 [Epithele typhae]
MPPAHFSTHSADDLNTGGTSGTIREGRARAILLADSSTKPVKPEGPDISITIHGRLPEHHRSTPAYSAIQYAPSSLCLRSGSGLNRLATETEMLCADVVQQEGIGFHFGTCIPAGAPSVADAELVHWATVHPRDPAGWPGTATQLEGHDCTTEPVRDWPGWVCEFQFEDRGGQDGSRVVRPSFNPPPHHLGDALSPRRTPAHAHTTPSPLARLRTTATCYLRVRHAGSDSQLPSDRVSASPNAYGTSKTRPCRSPRPAPRLWRRSRVAILTATWQARDSVQWFPAAPHVKLRTRPYAYGPPLMVLAGHELREMHLKPACGLAYFLALSADVTLTSTQQLRLQWQSPNIRPPSRPVRRK